MCERNRDPSRTTTPAGGLRLCSCWSCNQEILITYHSVTSRDGGTTIFNEGTVTITSPLRVSHQVEDRVDKMLSRAESKTLTVIPDP